MCLKRLHNIYQDIKILKFWVLVFKYLCILDFKLCHYKLCHILRTCTFSYHGFDFFVHGKIFLLLDTIKGVDTSEQIIVLLSFILFIYLFFISYQALLLWLHTWQVFSWFLTCGYPLLWLCVVVCASLCNSLTELNYWHWYGNT